MILLWEHSIEADRPLQSLAGECVPGPRKLATLKLIGRMRKARDWYFFSLVISATMVRL
jgi:hypothetical protein